MNKKRDFTHTHDIKISRKALKLPVRFLIHSETEEIVIDEGWTADYVGRFIEGVALTMDVGGLLIATHPDRIPSLGEKITAIFKLNSIEEKVNVEAEVVWINKYSNQHPKGFAVKFTDISTDKKTLLEGIDKSAIEIKKRNSDVNILNIPD
jgi:Tfp pilus assembly protein PilZ